MVLRLVLTLLAALQSLLDCSVGDIHSLWDEYQDWFNLHEQWAHFGLWITQPLGLPFSCNC